MNSICQGGMPKACLKLMDRGENGGGSRECREQLIRQINNRLSSSRCRQSLRSHELGNERVSADAKSFFPKHLVKSVTVEKFVIDIDGLSDSMSR